MGVTTTPPPSPANNTSTTTNTGTSSADLSTLMDNTAKANAENMKSFTTSLNQLMAAMMQMNERHEQENTAREAQHNQAMNNLVGQFVARENKHDEQIARMMDRAETAQRDHESALIKLMQNNQDAMMNVIKNSMRYASEAFYTKAKFAWQDQDETTTTQS